MTGRARQLPTLRDYQTMLDGHMYLVRSGMLLPNYTALGFQVVDTPAWAHARLHEAFQKGLHDTYMFEADAEGNEGHRMREDPDQPRSDGYVDGVRVSDWKNDCDLSTMLS